MSDTSESLNYECLIRPAPKCPGKWIAEYPDLIGCAAVGETADDAFRVSQEVLGIWIEHANKLGIRLPRPGIWKEATGDLRIRMTKTLHKELARESIRIGVSLNREIITLIERAVARIFFPPLVVGDNRGCLGDESLESPPRKPTGKRFAPEHDYSGTWLQRFPRPLHHNLQVIAEQEGVSLNLLISTLLSMELAISRQGKSAHS